MSALHIGFPLRLGSTGRSAGAGDDEHVRQMIEQLIFTSPGERVNRPDFGSELLQLAFAPNSDELAMALRFTLQACLQRYLGDLIEVGEVDVKNIDASFVVAVQYVVRRTGTSGSAELRREV